MTRYAEAQTGAAAVIAAGCPGGAMRTPFPGGGLIALRPVCCLLDEQPFEALLIQGRCQDAHRCAEPAQAFTGTEVSSNMPDVADPIPIFQ